MARNKAHWAEYMREYRKTHKEQIQGYRDKAEVKRLQRLGYTVTPPADQKAGITPEAETINN